MPWLRLYGTDLPKNSGRTSEKTRNHGFHPQWEVQQEIKQALSYGENGFQQYLGVLLDNKLSWKPHVQKVKTQLSRACGMLSKLKHYTTPPALKVVYNSLIHPYLNYSILDWGLASNATIQPLIKLQNKAIKIINPTNMGSLEEHFQHLNILCLPKVNSFSVGKFMHSYHNKLLPNHFDEYFIPLSSILYHSTRPATLETCFYLELTLPQENIISNLLAQMCGLQYQTISNFQPPLTLNGNLRNTSYMKKTSQLWTLATFHLSRTKHCVF